MPNLSVIIPVLDESENLPILAKKLSSLSDGFEFIFVDDGSTDGSRELIKDLSNHDSRFTGAFNERRIGHMGSYLVGLEHAHSKNIAIMDGDLQHPPEKLIPISEMLNDGYDIVVCSRYKGNKFIGDRDKVRGIISRSAEILLKLLVKNCRAVSDPLSGYIGFHRNLAIPVKAEMKGNKLLPFLLVANQAAKVGYINYQFTERTLGKSKIIGSGSRFMRNYVREIIQIWSTSKLYSRK